MKKIKNSIYQKQLEEGIKNLKVELEAKSAIFKQAKENEEEIKNLKIELEAKTAIYKEQRDTLNKERMLHKETQTKYKKLQSMYDLLSVQGYTSREKLKEANKTIEQLRKEIEISSLEKENQVEPKHLEKSEEALLTEQLEQLKQALKSEKEKNTELESRLKEVEDRLIEEQSNFEKKSLEGKAQIADLLIHLQSDYPSQLDLENARKIIRDADVLRGNSQEQAEKIIANAEAEVHEMKNMAKQEIAELNNKIQYYSEILDQISKTVDSSASTIRRD
ncbi:hypothetical protein EFE32_13365 [Lactococcus lactis subsp. lactis]|uniref:hypothetical protein n=1 Tax=Lactococcus lactis TaxID=1358 RepID=UPI00223BD4E8|nr:hypothetical protein [Lactococcus lactis]MCT0017753.1 hypothetical protein [Lactococcus lactis subsp. lactis]